MKSYFDDLPRKPPNKIILSEIILAMGGMMILRATIGISDIRGNGTVLQFRFRGSQTAQMCRIMYRPDQQDYVMEFYKVRSRNRPNQIKLVAQAIAISADLIPSCFYTQTGCSITLPNGSQPDST